MNSTVRARLHASAVKTAIAVNTDTTPQSRALAAYARDVTAATLDPDADILDLPFRPDSKTLATRTADNLDQLATKIKENNR